MALIAITREMGSLGIDVAQNVASALGVRLVHHEIVDAVADKMRVRRSHVVRLLDGRATLYERLKSADTKASLFTSAEILDLACSPGGVVLRGWGAAFLLHSVPHAVCARVCAPLWLRTRRMMERMNSDESLAVTREIRLNDEAHGAVIRRNFNCRSEDAENYDVVLSTERLSVDDASDELMNLTRHSTFQETEASRQALQDLRIKVHIKVGLRINPLTRNVIVGIHADQGVVKLTGVVDSGEVAREIISVANGVDSVKSVTSELRAIDAFRGRGQR